ncbi:MAG: hypothetical protein D6761_13515 [Candidatus Dadabacteria bacterium]|nr:MAG: hypothetical protein D6761_13515 [Candidatus Dadabacteria bacterium]
MLLAIILTAPDKPGLAEQAAATIRAAGGNVETSRMVRLGNEFTMALLVDFRGATTTPDALAAELQQAGFTTVVKPTTPGPAEDGLRYIVRAIGLDHPGIVAEISAAIRAAGGNIHSAETELVHAPWSGAPSFSFEAEVGLADASQARDLRALLEELAEREHLDIEVGPLRTR